MSGGTINALFASYDMAVGVNPRVTVGLVDDDHKQVSFGTAGAALRTAKTAFEVQPEHQVVAPGEEAPATDNPLPGETGIDPATIDSRAEDGGTVPDVALHAISVADAIESGLPTMVVVATPVFCQSRFCGPITDAVEELANEYEGRANFIHLEVWEDYEAERLTAAAEEGIVPVDAEGGNEPWVFLIDTEGTVLARWDNVASDPELREALDDAVG